MTRRKSNNVVRHSGGIGCGDASGPSSTFPPTYSHPTENDGFTGTFGISSSAYQQHPLENGVVTGTSGTYNPTSSHHTDNGTFEETNAATAKVGLEELIENTRQPHDFEVDRKPENLGEEKSDANLVMDLSSREESDNPQPLRESIGCSTGIVSASAGDATGADDMDMDDAGIYGDMAEGDMVAAMLEEAQIPRSQFLGLNAEEKQKLLEARRTCKFCGKVCIKRSDLQRHLLVHTGERPWLCKLCNKSFKAKRSLLYHQRSAHGLEINDVNGEPETKMPMLPIEWKDHQATPDILQPPREQLQHVPQQSASSTTHEAFPSTTLHPQLWANLTKLGWHMNVKPEAKGKMEPDQGLDLSASSGSTKQNAAGSSSIPGAATSTMETLIRQQREQLLARASLSSDPTANLDPNSAAAAFAIAAVAAAAAQQSNPMQQANASHLPPPMPYPTPPNNLPYFQVKPKAIDTEINQAKKRQRVASPEPPVMQKESTVVSAGESLLTANRQLETNYPSLRGHTLTITQPSNANAKFKINIQSESIVATKLEGLNVQTGAKTALYRCHICGKIVGFLSKLQSHLSLHYDRSNPVQMFACYICDEKFKYRQDLVDHVMDHQQNKSDLEQPPPLLASPIAANNQQPPTAANDTSPIEHFRNLIPSPPPLQHYPYQRNEDAIVNHVVMPSLHASSASSPESINQLSPRGLTSAMVQVQPLLPSASGLNAASSSSMSPMPTSPMSLPSYPTHSPSTPTTSNSGYPKKCRFCDKVFEKGYSLQRHERIHTGFKPCYCEECGRGFSEPRNLRHHILRYHSDDAAKQLEMLKRAHRSRNGTLPFGTNKEQQLALMQQQTKDPLSKEYLALPPATIEDSLRDCDSGKIPEFVPPSSSSVNLPSPSAAADGEGRSDVGHLEQTNAMEVHMEDDDRRSHMELMAENNPLDDDEDEEVYVDDDDRKREKPSEITQIASAFLEPEDLERMSQEDKETIMENQNDAGREVNGVPNSPTPGSPRPEDLPMQPHYPQSTNAPLVRDDATRDDLTTDSDLKNGASPPSPHADDASNASSCSKRSFTIPDAEALSPSDPLRHAGFNEDSFDGSNSMALTPMGDGELDPNGDPTMDPKSRILSKTNPRLAVVEPGIDRSAICKPRYVNGKAIYSCVFCDKEFCSYSDINRHLNFHEDLRPFKCKYCEYQSRTNSQLKVHMMRHQGIREFGCRICNYSGVTQSDVNRHKKSQQHLLKSQNVCVYCGLGFFKPVLLQQHLISEHPNGSAKSLNHSAYGEQLELEMP